MPEKNCAWTKYFDFWSTLIEELDRLFVLPIAVLVPAEQVVELPVEVELLRVVEPRDRLACVLADALDDVGGLGELRGELREPEQRLVELEVVRLVGDLGEDGVARLVELEAVERDREVVLRDLPVARVVARLALVDAVERQRAVAPLLAVEEPLGRGRLFGHLTGNGRRSRSSVVDVNVLPPLLLAVARLGSRGCGLRRRRGFLWLSLRLRLRRCFCFRGPPPPLCVRSSG